MNRREFVEKLGIGAAVGVSAVVGDVTASAIAQEDGHRHAQIDGPLAHATVSFGQWRTDPPLNRFPNLSPRLANQHLQVPYVATIKAGGAVSFIIAGFHQVLVYAPGSTLASIDRTLLVEAIPGVSPALINDPTNRLYRGLEPRSLPQDRVEVVTFAHPGLYLVVCGVLPHFDEGMHGFVKVV